MTQHFKVTRRAALLGAAGALAAPGIRPSFGQAAPIRVGVLHSLSGTMAISETALRDTVLMMIEWQNARGGILGRRLEPVVVDPPPTGRCLPRRRESCWPSPAWT
jgi:urea transport system substrate-binding protein